MSQKKGSFNNLDFNNIGSWPKQAKAVFCVLLALLIVVLSYLVVVRGMTEELDGLEQREVSLRQDKGWQDLSLKCEVQGPQVTRLTWQPLPGANKPL